MGATSIPSGGDMYLIHFAEPIGDVANPRGQARHYSLERDPGASPIRARSGERVP